MTAEEKKNIVLPCESKQIGNTAEEAVKSELKKQGYTEFIPIENRCGHGVDVIARNPSTGQVLIVEVKANDAKLNKRQRSLGGLDYTQNQLTRATEGEPGCWKTSEKLKGKEKIAAEAKAIELEENADKARKWLKEAKAKKATVEYKVYKVKVDKETLAVSKPFTISNWPKPE